MKSSKESSHHLYDNAFSSVEVPIGNTIEESILHRKRNIELPPEFPPFKIKSQGKSLKTSSNDKTSIFTNMSTPYDISHRLKTPKNSKRGIKKELDPSEEPTFVNLNPPKGKFWLSEKRLEAQKLQEKLAKLSKEAEAESKKAESEFDATTISIEKNLDAHQRTLDAFTEMADENSPERGAILHRIADYYRKLADEIPQIKSDFSERYKVATEELEKAEIERKSLEDERNKSLNVIERQNRTIEGLKQQIKDFQTRCANAEAQLRDAVNDKTAMARSSQTNQLKLVEIGKQILEKKAQQQKLSSLVDTLSKDISTRTAELRGATSELQDIEKELEKVRKEISSYRSIADDRTKLCQQLRNTPLRTASQAGRNTIAIQCNRVPKRQPQNKVGPSDPAFVSSIDNQAQFSQIKSDMTEIQKQMTPQEGGQISIKNFNDLTGVRETILKNNGIFDFSVDSITKAHGGNFDFQKTNEDESRIFAKWLMRRIMASALKSQSPKDESTQTENIEDVMGKPQDQNSTNEESVKVQKEFKVTEKTPKNLVSYIKHSRFVNMLQTDESDRKPRPLEWLIHTIRSIYDEKTVDDRTAIRDNQPIMSLPEYLLIWAFRQFGKPDLIQKGCWDVFITSHFYMQRFLEVTLFVRFLDEVFTIDQLSFFLNCRVWILQRCVSFPIMHDDLNLYFTETYLTPSQIDEFFHVTFPNTEPELLEDLTVRGCSCVDNIRLKASDSANIPMMRILELAMGEQQDERVRRIRKMLAFYRPVPRMTLKRFTLFIKNMISNIDPNMVDSLYRSGLIPNSVRTDIDHENFILMFKQNKKIVPSGFDKDDITCDEFAEFSPLFSMVLNRWKQFSPFLQRMMSNLSPNPNDGAKTIVSEIRHQIFQLLESKVSFDGALFYQNYHRVLQVAMKSCLKINLPDPLSFSKQVEDFQAILLKKFQAVVSVNEATEDEDN